MGVNSKLELIVNLTIYKARRYIYIYISAHFTDTTASTLTRRSAKTVKDRILKLF